MKEETSDCVFAWNCPPALEILNALSRATRNGVTIRRLAYIRQACENGSLRFLVICSGAGGGSGSPKPCSCAGGAPLTTIRRAKSSPAGEIRPRRPVHRAVLPSAATGSDRAAAGVYRVWAWSLRAGYEKICGLSRSESEKAKMNFVDLLKASALARVAIVLAMAVSSTAKRPQSRASNQRSSWRTTSMGSKHERRTPIGVLRVRRGIFPVKRAAKALIALPALLPAAGVGERAVAAMPMPSFINVEGVGIERGIAGVVCERGRAERAVRVRAVVLDLGDRTPRRDVLLAHRPLAPLFYIGPRPGCRPVEPPQFTSLGVNMTAFGHLASWSSKNRFAWIAVTAMWSGYASAQETPPQPELEFAFEVRAEVADPTVIGEVPNGLRRIIDIVGGTFEGPDLEGRVVPGGADWQIIREDGFTEVDARYTLETEDGDLIYVSNVGIRHAPPEVMERLNAGEAVDPSRIYFRAVPKFETAAPELEWLMRSIFVATGERYPNGVIIRFWRVL